LLVAVAIIFGAPSEIVTNPKNVATRACGISAISARARAGSAPTYHAVTLQNDGKKVDHKKLSAGTNSVIRPKIFSSDSSAGMRCGNYLKAQ
jgi:hypothetical protein